MIITAPDYPPILATLLFGSHARQDADASSDIDICVFVKSIYPEEMEHLRHAIALYYQPMEVCVSIYSEPTAYSMAQKGSLFLWHLRTEGRVLSEKESFTNRLFTSLQPFRAYDEELDIYHALVQDVTAKGGNLLEIDLHVLQLVVRNLCILLTYHHGCPKFGRTSPVHMAQTLYSDLPVSMAAFEELSYWHLIYSRGGVSERAMPDVDRCRCLAGTVDELVGYVKRVVS
jgi:hypothetical protein